MLEELPEPESTSLRMPLIPRDSKVLAPNGEPLAQVESSRIKPWMVCKSKLNPHTHDIMHAYCAYKKFQRRTQCKEIRHTV